MKNIRGISYSIKGAALKLFNLDFEGERGETLPWTIKILIHLYVSYTGFRNKHLAEVKQQIIPEQLNFCCTKLA